MSKKIVQTAGKDILGSFAPQFAHFNDDVLFAENWNNEDIDLKTRSLITVVSLMSMGICDSSLKYHLANAKAHGVSRKEIVAVITHNAFYAGWPKAWAVFALAKEVWPMDDENNALATGASLDSSSLSSAIAPDVTFAKDMIFPLGEPNVAYAEYFSGKSFLAPVSLSQVKIFNVTFEPTCRNNWHIHHAKAGGGQILIGVAGRGYYVAEGEAPIEIKPGTVVNIPAGVKHWHGAASDSWFAHLAVEVDGTETSNEWLAPVTDEEYQKATLSHSS